MKAKLIKMVEGYTLSLTGDIDDLYGISNQQLAEDHQLYKLSLKNCEAVVNGYDLNELACDKIGIDISVIKHIDSKLESHSSPCLPLNEGGCVGAGLYHMVKGFEIGFQKALEILGDKKFTEDDIRKTIFIVSSPLDTRYSSSEIISSLQQTEWDVEVCCYLGNGDKESDSFKDSLVTNTGIPKLDNNGCLILRRK